MLKPSAMTSDALAVALFWVDQQLDRLVDDEDSPLWDQRQVLRAEATRRSLPIRSERKVP
jgi:hypothetical protein